MTTEVKVPTLGESITEATLGKVPGADGLKTGHTSESGYGFTGSAEQNGRRLVMVVAGLSSWSASRLAFRASAGS